MSDGCEFHSIYNPNNAETQINILQIFDFNLLKNWSFSNKTHSSE